MSTRITVALLNDQGCVELEVNKENKLLAAEDALALYHALAAQLQQIERMARQSEDEQQRYFLSSQVTLQIA